MVTILFADDEPWFLDSIFHQLKEDNYRPIPAESAEEALEVLKKQPVQLLVLDIMMPYETLETMLRKGGDTVVNSAAADIWTGLRLYEEVKKLYPDLKVAIFSVLAEEEIREEAKANKIDMGQCVFLRKGGADSKGNLEKLYSLLPRSERA